MTIDNGLKPGVRPGFPVSKQKKFWRHPHGKIPHRPGQRMRKAVHKACGTQMGWYFGIRKKWPGFLMPPGEYVRMDGREPSAIDRRPWVQHMFGERCETCNRVVGPMEIELESTRTAADVRKSLGL